MVSIKSQRPIDDYNNKNKNNNNNVEDMNIQDSINYHKANLFLICYYYNTFV